MLQIKGNKIKRADKHLLNRFSKYVLDRYVKPSVQEEATIIIRFKDEADFAKKEDRKDLRECRAWTVYDGRRNRKRHFTLVVSNVTINKRAKTQITRLKDAIECIGHELIHIKQYLNNEIFDYKNNDVRFKGKRYTNWQDGEAYFFSPWEIEAYGHETGLYKCFKAKLKEEAKAK